MTWRAMSVMPYRPLPHATKVLPLGMNFTIASQGRAQNPVSAHQESNFEVSNLGLRGVKPRWCHAPCRNKTSDQTERLNESKQL